MKKSVNVIKLIGILFCATLFFSGCYQQSTSSKDNIRNIETVALSEDQQKLADGIWNARSLWSGCSELAIYKHDGKYYLAANMLVSEQKVPDLFGGQGSVGTYKRYAYSITENGEILDNLTLSDAGITSVGQRVSVVYFSGEDSAETQKALISQLVAKVSF